MHAHVVRSSHNHFSKIRSCRWIMASPESTKNTFAVRSASDLVQQFRHEGVEKLTGP